MSLSTWTHLLGALVLIVCSLSDICEDERQHTLEMKMVEEANIVPSVSLPDSVDVSLDSEHQAENKRFIDILYDEIRQGIEHIDLQHEDMFGEIMQVGELRKRETKLRESEDYELEGNQGGPKSQDDVNVCEELGEEEEINGQVERETESAISFDTDVGCSKNVTYSSDNYTSCNASVFPRNEPTSSVSFSPEEPNLELKQIFITGVFPSGYVTFSIQSNGNGSQLNFFKFPIYDCNTFNIYKKHIKFHDIYYMKNDRTNEIFPELYDCMNMKSLNLEIFREVAKTLKPTRKFPNINGEAEGVVCGVLKGTNHAFVNFDKNCSLLISYVLKLAVEDLISKPNFTFRHVNEFIPGTKYVVIDREKREYYRVAMASNHERRADTFRQVQEQRQQNEIEKEKYLKLSDEEKQGRENIRQQEREIQEEFIIVQDLETGMKRRVRQSWVHPISEICKELKHIPHQAKKIRVRYLNGNRDNLERRLFECYKKSKVVIVKQPQECFDIHRRLDWFLDYAMTTGLC